MRSITSLSRLCGTSALLLIAFLAACGSQDRKDSASTETPPVSPQRAAEPAPAGKNPLADTEWRLVEIQSPDDATGVKRPDDPSLYTMRLNADGSVAMRLNCNRANGKWSVEPSTDRSSGRFEFGPLAGTRAFCPPPSLDEPIIVQSKYVRSFLLKDGRLYLSLMADGGIQVWEPQSGAAAAGKSDLELEAAIRAASPSYTTAVAGDQKARYASARVDLNGDGRQEVFVYPMGPFFCGTGGCNLLVFSQGGDGYNLLGNFPISRVPVIVSTGKTAGWNDIWRLESGGGAKATYVRHAFDGKRYVSRERVSGDKAPAGTSILDGEVTFESGIPLEPRR